MAKKVREPKPVAAGSTEHERLRNTLKSIKTLKPGTGVPIPETEYEPIPRVSTGSLLVDYALGGGIPYGRICEFYGNEGSGKTTLALQTLANIQREGYETAVVDAEFNHDAEWAEKLGIDISRNWFVQPDFGEQALEVAEAYIESGIIRGVMIDSIAALIPEAEMEGNIGDSHMGLQARMMSQACRRLIGKAARANCVVIFINQTREKIGGYGDPTTTPGGKAVKFAASVRLDMRKGTVIKDAREEAIAHDLRIVVRKNRGGPQMRKVEAILNYEIGMDPVAEAVNFLPLSGLVQKAGSFYTVPQGDATPLKFQGEQKFIGWLREHPEQLEVWRPQLLHFLETGEVAS